MKRVSSQSRNAVVFDFDGLILDTETPEFKAWETIYREHGVSSLTIEEWAVCIGTAGALDPYLMLEERLACAIDRADVERRRRERGHALIAAECLRPGVLQILDEAAELGWRVGLSSSSPRSWVEANLREHGILDRFEILSTADDVERVKPDPALYRRTVQWLGVEPCKAVALEDSLNGLRSAKAAGLACVVVPNAMTGHLSFHEADRVLSSLVDLSLRTFFRDYS